MQYNIQMYIVLSSRVHMVVRKNVCGAKKFACNKANYNVSNKNNIQMKGDE